MEGMPRQEKTFDANDLSTHSLEWLLKQYHELGAIQDRTNAEEALLTDVQEELQKRGVDPSNVHSINEDV